MADAGGADAQWEKKVATLSSLCAVGSKSHIAFVGTALLAKATDLEVDVRSLKVSAATDGAYSARSVAQHVLAPEARRHKVDIGVTGKEPLNNQPYFRYAAVSRDMVVHRKSRAALDAVCDIVDELASITSQEAALSALAAFISVRRTFFKRPAPYGSPEASMALIEFIQAIEDFVTGDSEGGKRAQAVAAGLMDAFQDGRVVETSRINDPDRHFPGDIAAYGSVDDATMPKLRMTLEVRDKLVTTDDLAAFATKAMGLVPKAAVLAVARGQDRANLAIAKVQREAAEGGLELDVFVGWSDYARQIFFWTLDDAAKAIRLAHHSIYERLVELECSSDAQDSWLSWRPPGSNVSK